MDTLTGRDPPPTQSDQAGRLGGLHAAHWQPKEPTVTDTAAVLHRYAARRVPVLPLHNPADGGCSCGWLACPSPAKHPRLGHAHPKGDPLRHTCKGECGRPGHGVHDATLNHDLIDEWLARWPAANWGIAPPPGYVVLDVDPRNGGDDTLSKLEDRYGDLPKTRTALTGSGGWHYWFLHDEPSRGKFAPGIDVKKAGGYVVAPPSLHICGGRYEWIDERSAVVAPLWVRDLLDIIPPRPAQTTHHRPDPTPGDALAGLIKFVSESPEGQRNNRLYWAACRAVGAGHDTAPLLRAAEDIGVPRHEAEATINSATHAPVRDTPTPLRDPGRWRERARL